jgi:Tfp pilus assembly protein PilN
MLYGINDPLPIIQRWNELQQHPDLTKEQIKQIKELEQQKQQLLQRGKYCGN